MVIQVEVCNECDHYLRKQGKKLLCSFFEASAQNNFQFSKNYGTVEPRYNKVLTDIYISGLSFLSYDAFHAHRHSNTWPLTIVHFVLSKV